MRNLKSLLKNFPVVWSGLAYVHHRVRKFQGSGVYWESRYANGGTSGSGSYGKLAQFKAEFLNQFVQANDIDSVVEFGCGDGNQLNLAKYPRYLGLDISPSVIARCQLKFAGDHSKSFATLGQPGADLLEHRSDLSLSLDVIYHLIEDPVFDSYMQQVFDAGQRFVIAYSSNFDAPARFHVRHRKFTDWVAVNRPDFTLTHMEKNQFPYNGDDTTGTRADFYVYQRRS
jgi:SAM-dependent methyltransferase